MFRYKRHLFSRGNGYKKVFRFEYGYPLSSCYLESDLKYMASKSRSLSFNHDRFIYNSRWMGVRFWHINQRYADWIEARYAVDTKYNFGAYMEGSAVGKANSEPFFFRVGNDVFFTMRAIFAGRDRGTRIWSLRESCDAKCLVCNTKIRSEMDFYNKNRVNGGVVLDTNSERFEIVCNNCFGKWRKHQNPYRYQNCLHNRPSEDDFGWNYYLCPNEQISFTRFFLQASAIREG